MVMLLICLIGLLISMIVLFRCSVLFIVVLVLGLVKWLWMKCLVMFLMWKCLLMVVRYFLWLWLKNVVWYVVKVLLVLFIFGY